MKFFKLLPLVGMWAVTVVLACNCKSEEPLTQDEMANRLGDIIVQLDTQQRDAFSRFESQLNAPGTLDQTAEAAMLFAQQWAEAFDGARAACYDLGDIDQTAFGRLRWDFCAGLADEQSGVMSALRIRATLGLAAFAKTLDEVYSRAVYEEGYLAEICSRMKELLRAEAGAESLQCRSLQSDIGRGVADLLRARIDPKVELLPALDIGEGDREVRVLREVSLADAGVAEIRVPNGDGPWPMVISLDDPDQGTFLASNEDLAWGTLLAAQGTVVVNLRQLGPADEGSSLKCAVRRVRELAGEFAGDPDNVTLLGWNRQAEVALAAALSAREPIECGGSSTYVPDNFVGLFDTNPALSSLADNLAEGDRSVRLMLVFPKNGGSIFSPVEKKGLQEFTSAATAAGYDAQLRELGSWYSGSRVYADRGLRAAAKAISAFLY